MPNSTRTLDPQYQLNHQTPASSRAKLGDCINDLITSLNTKILRDNTQVLSDAGLAITAGGSAIVKAANAFVATVGGVLVAKAANQAMSAIVGTLPTANTGVWLFYIDATGTITTSAMFSGATLAAALALVTPPAAGQALIGMIAVANATGANFVGGTTALDAVSVTTTYFSTTGSFILAADSASTALTTLANR